ncbi:hypothetical protein VTK73DRAFT_219 [Phialemonium thermophilum]|uniref:Uncharacterized protein n=1 Tax=Phialemonium thermophilum TaxID=223376 RepID=A0ABR3VWA5_9PEZI
MRYIPEANAPAMRRYRLRAKDLSNPTLMDLHACAMSAKKSLRWMETMISRDRNSDVLTLAQNRDLIDYIHDAAMCAERLRRKARMNVLEDAESRITTNARFLIRVFHEQMDTLIQYLTICEGLNTIPPDLPRHQIEKLQPEWLASANRAVFQSERQYFRRKAHAAARKILWRRKFDDIPESPLFTPEPSFLLPQVRSSSTAEERSPSESATKAQTEEAEKILESIERRDFAEPQEEKAAGPVRSGTYRLSSTPLSGSPVPAPEPEQATTAASACAPATRIRSPSVPIPETEQATTAATRPEIAAQQPQLSIGTATSAPHTPHTPESQTKAEQRGTKRPAPEEWVPTSSAKRRWDAPTPGDESPESVALRRQLTAFLKAEEEGATAVPAAKGDTSSVEEQASLMPPPPLPQPISAKPHGHSQETWTTMPSASEQVSMAEPTPPQPAFQLTLPPSPPKLAPLPSGSPTPPAQPIETPGESGEPTDEEQRTPTEEEIEEMMGFKRPPTPEPEEGPDGTEEEAADWRERYEVFDSLCSRNQDPTADPEAVDLMLTMANELLPQAIAWLKDNNELGKKRLSPPEKIVKKRNEEREMIERLARHARLRIRRARRRAHQIRHGETPLPFTAEDELEVYPTPPQPPPPRTMRTLGYENLREAEDAARGVYDTAHHLDGISKFADVSTPGYLADERNDARKGHIGIA